MKQLSLITVLLVGILSLACGAPPLNTNANTQTVTPRTYKVICYSGEKEIKKSDIATGLVFKTSSLLEYKEGSKTVYCNGTWTAE